MQTSTSSLVQELDVTVDRPAMAAAADTALMRFSVWYQHIHGYLSLVACVFAPVKVIGQGHGS